VQLLAVAAPRFTLRIIRFSVAMNGSSSISRRRIISGCTTRPEATLCMISSTASTLRYASGTAIRLFAESSSVRSNHCVAAVNAGSITSVMACRASAVIRSVRIGLRLYGIADEPIWCSSHGSSTSLRCERSRMSCANFDADCAMPASVERQA
jgi:hypothetical protein